MDRAPARFRGVNAVVRRWEILILIAASFLLQLFFAFFFPTGLYLDLALILALYIGWYSSPTRGMLAGFAFGLAQDVAFGQLIGLNGLSKTVIGYTSSFVGKLFRFDVIIGRFTVMVAYSCLDTLIHYGLLRLLDQPISSRFWMGTLVKAGVTAVAGAIGSRFYDRYKFPKKDFRKVSIA